MALLRTPIDKLCSDLTRECAGWRCESCNLYFPEGARQMLHCSHYYSRAIYATRWWPDNLFSHCAHCHEYFGKRPAEFTRWAREHLGEEKHRAVMLRAKTVYKISPRQKEFLRLHLLNEWARVCQARQEGFSGRLDWSYPDEPLGDAEPKPKRKAKKSSLAKAKKKIAGKPFSKKYKRKINGTTVRRDAA